MSDLQQLLEQEIPEGRQHLQENFKNLEQVAQYCQENYLQAKDKKSALEETKNYTTHSLASVAYQINNLATNFLKLLDLQQNQLAEMESNVNHLAQTVNIHKEKVARREIGVLTTNKSTTRQIGVKNGIIFPEHGERPTKYQRKNIDYTQLDEIGHGVKSTPAVSQSSRSNSVSSSSSTPAPQQQPPTPPQNTGSIGRAQGQQMLGGPGNYRTNAPTVAPPTVPNEYFSSQQLQQGGPGRQSGYLPGHQAFAPGTPPVMGIPKMPPGMMPGGPQSMMGGQGPPTGVARPMSQNMPPPPAPPGMMMDRQSQNLPQNSIDESMPPPPPMDTPVRESQNVSFDEGSPPPPPPPQFDDEDDMMPQPEEDPYAATGPEMYIASVPDNYLEKVIAIYDYAADKDDELSFTENSVIYVMKKNDDGWYEGVFNGLTGLFPGNYVEPCI